jgi:hypothetical protein
MFVQNQRQVGPLWNRQRHLKTIANCTHQFEKQPAGPQKIQRLNQNGWYGIVVKNTRGPVCIRFPPRLISALGSSNRASAVAQIGPATHLRSQAFNPGVCCSGQGSNRGEFPPLAEPTAAGGPRHQIRLAQYRSRESRMGGRDHKPLCTTNQELPRQSDRRTSYSGAVRCQGANPVWNRQGNPCFPERACLARMWRPDNYR